MELSAIPTAFGAIVLIFVAFFTITLPMRVNIRGIGEVGPKFAELTL